MRLFLNKDWENKASEKSKGVVEAFAHAILLFACFAPLFLITSVGVASGQAMVVTLPAPTHTKPRYGGYSKRCGSHDEETFMQHLLGAGPCTEHFKKIQKKRKMQP